jgi:SAM-dependent methyltransferase
VKDRELQDAVSQSLFTLLNHDAEQFARGVYPLSLLKPGNPINHCLRLGRLLGDGVRLQRQKARGRTTEFSNRARDLAEDLPRYYRRNFHFQKDGYLSSESADLYEHQVEILFGGAADAMRRMILEPLVERWGGTEGRGLRFLEIGAGTGRTSLMLRQVFPKAHVTVTELSDPYLRAARRQMHQSDRVDFVQCAGEALPFQTGIFDAVISVFLFHELPSEVRSKVVHESIRVAKPGGILAAVDSLQRSDAPAWGSLLEQFSVDFHEPFYRNYIDEPLEALFSGQGVADVQCRTGFVSKLAWGRRPSG